MTPSDLDFLQRAGLAGHLPQWPYCDPLKSRYATFEFDERELQAASALSDDVRREVMFLCTVAGLLDHFEFLGIEATDSRRVIRDGYRSFTKRMHPDAYFGKDLGPFTERLAWSFARGTQIWEWMKDAEFRGAYSRCVLHRNEVFRAAKAKAEAEAAAAAEAQRRADRKKDLRARLRHNKSRFNRS